MIGKSKKSTGQLTGCTGNQYFMTEFEWDPNKAVSNIHRHGVTFQQAVKAFSDCLAVEWIDDREDYGEERFNLLGMCDGVILHVTYTERDDDRIRIISARRGEKHEQEHYYRENSI